jgi:hypothetical protein
MEGIVNNLLLSLMHIPQFTILRNLFCTRVYEQLKFPTVLLHQSKRCSILRL